MAKSWPGTDEPMSVAWDWDWVHGWSRSPVTPAYLADLMERLDALESRLKKLEEALHGKSPDGQDPAQGQR